MEDILSSTGLLESAQRTRLSVISQQLEVKLRVLQDMDKEILDRCEVSSISTELDESETWTAKALSCKQKIVNVMITPTTIHSPTVPTSATIHNPTISTPPTPAVAQPRPRLPKLTLPKFRGDVKNWPAFWDSFQSAIHNNDDIPKVDKFNYLNSLLEGPAFKTIQGFTLTGSNYDSAIQMLQERFGDPQQIISAHMEGLLKISTCVSDRPGSLRAV